MVIITFSFSFNLLGIKAILPQVYLHLQIAPWNLSYHLELKHKGSEVKPLIYFNHFKQLNAKCKIFDH